MFSLTLKNYNFKKIISDVFGLPENYLETNEKSSFKIIEPVKASFNAYFNEYHFLNGKQDCWQQFNTSSLQTTKKKLIYSAGSQLIDDLFIQIGIGYSHVISLNSLKQDNKIFDLIDTLFQYFEIWLWPNAATSMAECTPFMQKSDFWHALDKVHPSVSAEKVRNSLLDQGIDLNQFHILDEVVLVQLLQKVEIDEKQCTGRDKNIEQLEKEFPDFSILAAEGLVISHCEFALKSTLKELRIHKFDVLSRIRFSYNYPQLEFLSITHCPNLSKIDLSGLSQLKFLAIKYECIIPHPELVLFNIKECSELRILLLHYCAGNTITSALSQLKSLRVLFVIQNTTRQTLLDLEHQQYLLALSVANTAVIIKNIEQCDQLGLLAIKADEIDLGSSIPKLYGISSEINDTEYYKNYFLYFRPYDESLMTKRQEPWPAYFIFPQEDYGDEEEDDEDHVSVLPLRKKINVDANTKLTNKFYSASGSLSVELRSNFQTTCDDYRIFILDKIEYKSSIITCSLQFIQSSSAYKEVSVVSDSVQNLNVQSILENNSHAVVGAFKSTLDKNHYYPLPDLGSVMANNLTIYSEDSSALSFYWHASYQQYYCKVSQTTEVHFFYVCYLRDHYDAQHSNLLEPLKSSNLLSSKLRNACKEALQKESKLNFLWDTTLTLNKKLTELITYCRNFENSALTSKEGTDLDILLRIISEKKGFCCHRAEAFVLLAQYLGIPARAIYNEQHAFCEIPYGNSDEPQWNSIDLGGASGRKDLTPPELRASLFASIESESSVMPNSYTALFQAYVQQQRLDSFDPLINKQYSLVPLIVLQAGQTACRVYQQLAHTLEQRGYHVQNDYFYIEGPEDLIRYVCPRQIKNNQLRSIEGPLFPFIQAKEKKWLLINWSKFSAKALASYKSVLDRPPTFLGRSISASLHVIGLTDDASRMGEAFLSRCQQWILNPIVFKNFSNSDCSQYNTDKKSIVVDLFRSDYRWQELLFGTIEFFGKEVQLQEGPLQQAAREKCDLIIHNPPEYDPDFKSLLAQLATQKQFFHNGSFHQFFGKLHCKQVQGRLSCPITVWIQKASAYDSVKIRRSNPPIYLNLQTLHLCFRQQRISEKGIQTLPGLLVTCTANDFFYVTEDLGTGWQELWTHIQHHVPGKTLDFVLAPGVASPVEMIEAVNDTVITESFTIKQSDLASLKLDDLPSIIVSNDPDFFAKQFSQQHRALIVDVTPETNLQTLIANTFLSTEHTTALLFQYQEQILWQNLKQGEMVILNGHLTYDLYQQLLPLFRKNARINFNGEQQTISGRLFAVVPDHSQDYPIAIIPQGACHYTFADYNGFLDKRDQNTVRHIKKFYQLAERMPLIGLGQPKQHVLSYQRLVQCLNALKKQQGLRNNPIKLIWHHNYLKNTEAYAYLNVIAKQIFSHQKKDAKQWMKETVFLITKKQHKKLTQLIRKSGCLENSDQLKAYTWRLLNCLPLLALNNLLGTDLMSALDPNITKPYLHPERFAKFEAMLRNDGFRLITIPVVARMHVEKRQIQLTNCLFDSEIPLIFIKGSPGSGKTHYVRHIANQETIHFYEGDGQIVAWLRDTTEKIKLLLLDEANRALPGHWDFLKGLYRKPARIYYQGQIYPFTVKHKVIATGNLETDPGRHFHGLFQQYAVTILFKQPDRNFIQEQIGKPILQSYNCYEPSYLRALLAAFDLVRHYKPFFPFSIRDFQQLVHRFSVACVLRNVNNNLNNTVIDSLEQTCCAAFYGLFQEKKLRQKFSTEIRFIAEMMLGVRANDLGDKPTVLPITPEHVLPGTKAYLLHAIEQDLTMRNYAITHSHCEYPRGILLEGNPGLGKSSLYRAILKREGFDKNHPDPAKRYYELSAGNAQQTRALLLQAFHEGSIVVLDELNLDSDLEIFINSLLSGEDPEGKPAKKRGFMLWSSQNVANGQSKDELKPTSNAQRNRIHYLYCEPFSDEELLALLNYKKIPEPEEFLHAYKRAQEMNSNVINTRTFFTGLKCVVAQEGFVPLGIRLQ